MTRSEFYDTVSYILGRGEYVEPLPYIRRWGQRAPGNGRYEGFGLVRWFSEKQIHIIGVGINKTFNNPEDAIRFIKNLDV